MTIREVIVKKTSGKEEDIKKSPITPRISHGRKILRKRLPGHVVIIGETIGEYAKIGKYVDDNSIVIGKTTGAGSSIGLSMTGNGIAIGKTTGEKSYVGRQMHLNSVAIGKTTGKAASVGTIISHNSVVIGKTTGEKSYVGHQVNLNSIAIGFERKKFVIKSTTGMKKSTTGTLVEQKPSDFTSNVKKLNKLLDLGDFLDDDLFETKPYTSYNGRKYVLDPDEPEETIKFKTEALKKSGVLKLGNKQILPIEGKPRNLQFLKQIGEYDRICEILTTAEAILIELRVPEEYWKETFDIQKKRFEMKSMELVEVKAPRFPKKVYQVTIPKKEIQKLLHNISEELDEKIQEKFSEVKKEREASVKDQKRTAILEIFKNKEKGVMHSLEIEFEDNKLKRVYIKNWTENPSREATRYTQNFNDLCLDIIREKIHGAIDKEIIKLNKKK